MSEKDERFKTVEKALALMGNLTLGGPALASIQAELSETRKENERLLQQGELWQQRLAEARRERAAFEAGWEIVERELGEARGLLEGIVPRMYGARITSAGPTTSWDLTTSGPHLNAIIDFLQRTENP